MCRLLTCFLKSELHTKLYSTQLPPPPAHQAHFPSVLVSPQSHCLLLYLSFISFCNNKQIYVHALIFFSSTKASILLCLLPLIFFLFDVVPWKSLCVTSQRSDSNFFVTVSHSLVKTFRKHFCNYKRRFRVHPCLYYMQGLMTRDFLK